VIIDVTSKLLLYVFRCFSNRIRQHNYCVYPQVHLHRICNNMHATTLLSYCMRLYCIRLILLVDQVQKYFDTIIIVMQFLIIVLRFRPNIRFDGKPRKHKNRNTPSVYNYLLSTAVRMCALYSYITKL